MNLLNKTLKCSHFPIKPFKHIDFQFFCTLNESGMTLDGSYWLHKVFGFDVASPIEVNLEFEVNVLTVRHLFHKVLKIWRLCNVGTIIGMETSIVIHEDYNQTIFFVKLLITKWKYNLKKIIWIWQTRNSSMNTK